MVLLNKKNIIRITLIVIVSITLFYGGKFLVQRFMTREGYSSSYSGNVNDVGDQYVNPSLYREDKGRIGKRKQFANMKKPYLNPIFKPVIPSQTE